MRDDDRWHDAHPSVTSLEEWRSHFGLAELRCLLSRVWDPIGVYGDCRHVGEYDDYGERVLDALRDGTSPDELAQLLERMARDDIGVPRPAQRAADAATAIATWYTDAISRLNRG